MKRTIAMAMAGALLLAGPAHVQPAGQTPANGPLDLAAFFGAGGMVRDSNGDGIADSVAARVIVPASASIEDAAGVANIAGRLGFETSSLTLPLVLHDAGVAQPAAIEVPILIGRSNRFIRSLIDRGVLDLTTLRAGQGLVTAVRAPLGGADGIVIVGGDDKGTLAAANMFAARLPRLWNMTGITLAGVAGQVSRYLGSRGIDTRPVVSPLVVDSDRRGLARVTVGAPLSTAAAPRARRALEDLDRFQRRRSRQLQRADQQHHVGRVRPVDDDPSEHQRTVTAGGDRRAVQVLEERREPMACERPRAQFSRTTRTNPPIDCASGATCCIA